MNSLEIRWAHEDGKHRDNPTTLCSACRDTMPQNKAEKAYLASGTPLRVRVLRKALVACADELERLRYVLLPRYEGMIGEPDAKVLQRARKALKG